MSLIRWQLAPQTTAALRLPWRVAVARPEGSERALPTFVIEGVEALVEVLRAA
jgi:hypothetical protein